MYKLITEKPDYKKFVDDIVDVYGNNMLDFCLLNGCNINVLKMLLYNYKYNVYSFHNKENIIIKTIRIDNQEFINLLKQSGYNINNGIIFFIHKINDFK